MFLQILGEVHGRNIKWCITWLANISLKSTRQMSRTWYLVVLLYIIFHLSLSWSSSPCCWLPRICAEIIMILDTSDHCCGLRAYLRYSKQVLWPGFGGKVCFVYWVLFFALNFFRNSLYTATRLLCDTMAGRCSLETPQLVIVPVRLTHGLRLRNRTLCKSRIHSLFPSFFDSCLSGI